MKIVCFFLLAIMMFSCAEKNSNKSAYADYFYPYDTIPKIYVYRDVVGGLNEQFHRVYGVKDEAGKHIIVELYSSDFRLTEALNYNYPSLELQDHMVTNGKKQKSKADLIKSKAFPLGDHDTSEFLSRLPSHIDSTKIIQLKKRVLKNKKEAILYLNKKIPAISFYDTINLAVVNSKDKQLNKLYGAQLVYFAKDIGKVEWHSMDKKAHYKLEKIMNQKDWINIIQQLK